MDDDWQYPHGFAGYRAAWRGHVAKAWLRSERVGPGPGTWPIGTVSKGQRERAWKIQEHLQWAWRIDRISGWSFFFGDLSMAFNGCVMVFSIMFSIYGFY